MPRRYRVQGELRPRKLGTTGTTTGPSIVGSGTPPSTGGYRPMGAGIAAPTNPTVSGGLAGTWSQIFLDEFATFDTTKWSVREPWESNVGYIKEAAWCPTTLPLPTSVLQVDNSLLILKIRKQRLANQPATFNDHRQISMPLEFTGVNINTRDKFTLPGSATTTTFSEVRYNNPSGRGLWTAPLWSIGFDPWPRSGEIDFPELINPNNPEFGRTLCTLHWYDSRFDLGPGSNYGHLQTGWQSGQDAANRHNVWRTMGLLRTPDALTIYDNGVPVVTWNRGVAYGGYNPSSPLPDYLFRAPHMLMIDMKVGGGWAGSGWTQDQYEEGDMGIDYVKVWQKTA